MKPLADELDEIYEKYYDELDTHDDRFTLRGMLSDFLSEITDAYQRREKALGVDLDQAVEK